MPFVFYLKVYNHTYSYKERYIYEYQLPERDFDEWQ